MYTIYKQGVAQGNIALVDEKIQCGPTIEMVLETGPRGIPSWIRIHKSLNRLVESMRLPKQSDADLYASLSRRLSGFLYVVEQDVLSTKGGPGSGNFGHAGRPGLVGGSGSGNGNTAVGRVDEGGLDDAARAIAMLNEKNPTLHHELHGIPFDKDAYNDNSSFTRAQSIAAKQKVTMALYTAMNTENGFDLNIVPEDAEEKRKFEAACRNLMEVNRSEEHLNRSLERSVRESPVLQRYAETYKKERQAILDAYPGIDTYVAQLFNPGYVSYAEVRDAVHQWAESSNDSDLRSLHMQKIVGEEFRIPLTKYQEDRYAHVMRTRERNIVEAPELSLHTRDSFPFEIRKTDEVFGDFLVETRGLNNRTREQADQLSRLFVRTMYANTQKDLSRIPGDSLRVYRGFGTQERTTYPLGEIVSLVQNPLESWSTSSRIAELFSKGGEGQQIVLGMDISKSRVFATPNTGIGALNEFEVVLLGNPDNTDQAAVLSSVSMWDSEPDFEEIMIVPEPK
jgi:hypothetical protein